MELPQAVRGRFRRRAYVIPLPIASFDHDVGLSKSVARRRLGLPLDASTPLIAYLPGANQPDLSDLVFDPQGRYKLLTIHRAAAATGELTAHWGGWTYLGRPDDETFGAIIAASDAVLLSHAGAFGSLTAHAAALLERPVLSPACPATAELRRLGCAADVSPPLSPASVWEAFSELRPTEGDGYQAYRDAHSNEAVQVAALAAYRGLRGRT